MLTITDLFCGAGGSSSGAGQVPGVRVAMAANHWRLAVDTHQANVPHADHDCADLSQVDPHRYARTDLLWASPSCTHHSKAQGRRKAAQDTTLFDTPRNMNDADAAERSRATMWDALRFAEHHQYRAMVVENVVDVRDWVMWPAWRHALDCLGYLSRVVYLNSMHAGQLGDPAPQSRDRLYVIAWRHGERAPDLDRWTRPVVHCPACDTTAPAIQAWKRPDRGYGVYGRHGQYWWRCPTAGCHQIVHPPVLPAAAAIDWTIRGVRIGDRIEPLRPATIRRIRAGLARYGPAPTLVPAGGTWNDDARPVSEPMRTRTARETEGLAIPPLLVPVEGPQGVSTRPVRNPARTQTARLQDALVVPPHHHATRPAAAHPPATLATSGEHHMLVSYYGNGSARPAAEPIATIPTRDRFALVGTNTPDVADCTFRMLNVAEIQAGMAIPSDFVLLGNAKRDKVRMLGNAVTPPAARDLIAALVEAITGDTVDQPHHTPGMAA